MTDSTDTRPLIIGPYEIRYVPTGIVGQWYVVDRRINIHVQVFRSREEAVAWARRVASAQREEQQAE